MPAQALGQIGDGAGEVGVVVDVQPADAAVLTRLGVGRVVGVGDERVQRRPIRELDQRDQRRVEPRALDRLDIARARQILAAVLRGEVVHRGGVGRHPGVVGHLDAGDEERGHCVSLPESPQHSTRSPAEREGLPRAGDPGVPPTPAAGARTPHPNPPRPPYPARSPCRETARAAAELAATPALVPRPRRHDGRLRRRRRRRRPARRGARAAGL